MNIVGYGCNIFACLYHISIIDWLSYKELYVQYYSIHGRMHQLIFRNGLVVVVFLLYSGTTMNPYLTLSTL